MTTSCTGPDDLAERTLRPDADAGPEALLVASDIATAQARPDGSVAEAGQ
jgi:hypothetical protein